MKLEDILSGFSNDTKRLNPDLFATKDQAVYPSQGAVTEPPVPDRPMGKKNGKGIYPGRCAIRVHSVRSRLIDPDNLCAKYFVDALRYAGIIADDTAQEIEYTITQRKARKTEEEHTTIEIIPL